MTSNHDDSRKGIIMTSTEERIAFVTDDGETISSHFGRATLYEVITLRDGSVAGRERRSKAGHHSFGGSPGQESAVSHEDRHQTMTAPIRDCSILVARGMGMGAHNHLQAAGIRTVLTDLHSIDEAVTAILNNTLEHDSRRLHEHGQGHHH